MVDSKNHDRRFYNYPQPRQGPNRPYKHKEDKNPVIRGLPLVLGAAAVCHIDSVAKFLWKNAGFSTLAGIKELQDYTPRFDPTVIPLASETASPIENKELAPDKVPGSKYHSTADYRALYLSGTLTPLAVAQALLPLIRRDIKPPGPHSVAFIETKAELILKAADESTKRYAAGQSIGPLDGVPFATKDELDMEGYRTTSGTACDFTPPGGGTAWAVLKLEEAGAINMGKLTMHELGLDTNNNNPIYGTPRNPYNSQYYTGGSSGGSGYVVASGLVPFSVGMDGGGSIRVPSSFCGVYGLKPSHGRISYQSSVDYHNSTTVAGPLAASMDDLELAYYTMAIPDPKSTISAMFSQPNVTSGDNQGPKVLGLCKDWINQASEPVKKALYQSVQYYQEKLGYTVKDVDIPFLVEGQVAHALTILAETVDSAQDGKNWSSYTPGNRVLLAVGSQTTAPHYVAAQRVRNLLMQHLAFLFATFPGMIIVTPTTPNAGWPIHPGDLKHGFSDGNMSIRTMTYVWLANFTGCPALSVPVGYATPVKGSGDVPIGLMGMGEWGSEGALIGWGRGAEKFLEEKVDSGRRRATNWEDILGKSSG